jgi:hypothetical protein
MRLAFNIYGSSASTVNTDLAVLRLDTCKDRVWFGRRCEEKTAARREAFPLWTGATRKSPGHGEGFSSPGVFIGGDDRSRGRQPISTRLTRPSVIRSRCTTCIRPGLMVSSHNVADACMFTRTRQRMCCQTFRLTHFHIEGRIFWDKVRGRKRQFVRQSSVCQDRTIFSSQRSQRSALSSRLETQLFKVIPTTRDVWASCQEKGSRYSQEETVVR